MEFGLNSVPVSAQRAPSYNSVRIAVLKQSATAAAVWVKDHDDGQLPTLL